MVKAVPTSAKKVEIHFFVNFEKSQKTAFLRFKKFVNFRNSQKSEFSKFCEFSVFCEFFESQNPGAGVVNSQKHPQYFVILAYKRGQFFVTACTTHERRAIKAETASTSDSSAGAVVQLEKINITKLFRRWTVSEHHFARGA